MDEDFIFEEVYDCDDCDTEEVEDGMEMKLHGGQCCGIKHIHNMGINPEGICSARAAKSGSETSFGRHPVNGVNDAHCAQYPEDFYCEEAPKEKKTERLDRMLNWLRSKRAHGIVEIVVTNGQSQWFPVLEAKGFKKVSEATNSNTGNMLNVFHLCY